MPPTFNQIGTNSEDVPKVASQRLEKLVGIYRPELDPHNDLAYLHILVFSGSSPSEACIPPEFASIAAERGAFTVVIGPQSSSDEPQPYSYLTSTLEDATRSLDLFIPLLRAATNKIPFSFFHIINIEGVEIAAGMENELIKLASLLLGKGGILAIDDVLWRKEEQAEMMLVEI